MTIDDEDEEDANEGEYCEGARRILRVIASASLACLMEIVLQSSTYSSREDEGGGRESEGHDWGWHDPRKPEGREETWDLYSSSSHPRARIYFGTLSMTYMEQALYRPRCPLLTIRRIMH